MRGSTVIRIMKNAFLTHSNGVPFVVRVVFPRDGYGAWRDDAWALIHKGDAPLVEFFDARYGHSPYGQFVSRYNLDTILEHEKGVGLNLMGGVPDWSLDGKCMSAVIAKLSALVDKDKAMETHVVTLRRYGDDTDTIHVVRAPNFELAWETAKAEFIETMDIDPERVISGESQHVSTEFGAGSPVTFLQEHGGVTNWAPSDSDGLQERQRA